MNNPKRFLGRTKEEWKMRVEESQSELKRLAEKRHNALTDGDGVKAKELETEINIVRGTLLAAEQALSFIKV